MRRFTYILLFAALLSAGSCGHKTDSKPTVEEQHIDTIPTLVMQIQKCARLYTTEYHIHKIVTHDDQLAMKGRLLNHDYNIALPLGKRKIAIPVDATVKAYVDFAGFSEHNVRRDSTHIEIILPNPHIVLTASNIDHKGIREYVALMRRKFSDKELASYEQQGRDAIIADITKTDIIETARQNAANTLVPMLTAMGFSQENITVSFSRDFAPNDIIHIVEQSNPEKKNYGKAEQQ